MSAQRLVPRRVEKVWGRRDLIPAFGDVPAESAPVGEIWFEDPRGEEAALLVKYLFTSEKLSIQVHPDDAAARALGHARGKDEAWVILSADPEALIGIGLREPLDKASLRGAAEDGAIDALLDWRSARAGDIYYSPAGTVHALGPGLKLIEVQQNCELTYRLYDFGRPRALHLDEAVAAARPEPYRAPFDPYWREPGRLILAEGQKFVLERWSGARSGRLSADGPVWLIPVCGHGTVDGQPFEAGSVWLIDGTAHLDAGADSDLLVAYEGAVLRAPVD